MTADDCDWVFGVHGVRALLSASPESVRRLLLAEGRRGREQQELAQLAAASGIRVERVPRQALSRKAAQAAFRANHQGVGAERQALVPSSETAFEAHWPNYRDPLLVLLDGIADPRNLGACLRVADAAGADAVLLPKRGSAPLSSVAAKAASGAMEHLKIVAVANLARRMDWLRQRGVWLLGGVGEDDGIPYTEVDCRGAVGIVVGSEGRGLRRLTRQHCDYLVNIPLAGSVQSLNASVALGVLLFEARRQRTGG